MAGRVERSGLDLVIVGAGPVGLFAAHYAGFRSLRHRVLESLPFVGGQISTFYPDRLLYDVPGFPAVRGAELVERLHAQARAQDAEILLGARVTRLEPTSRTVRVHWLSEEDEQETHVEETAAVLLTTGIGRFAPQRLRDPAIASWSGRGLSYHVSDARRWSGRRVLVAGGTARGVGLALDAAAAGADVWLAHRRDRLAIDEDLRLAFERSPVRFLPHQELTRLEGSSAIERAVLTDRRTGTTETLAVDVVAPCFGYAAHGDALGAFGVQTEAGAITVDSTMCAAPRIWAAGDAVTYRGKVRVLAADLGEACTAVNNIAATLDPAAGVFPGYSSHRGAAGGRQR